MYVKTKKNTKNIEFLVFLQKYGDVFGFDGEWKTGRKACGIFLCNTQKNKGMLKRKQ